MHKKRVISCDEESQNVNELQCSIHENSKKGLAAKVLWYMPIVPRFKRLFANGDDAKDLT